MAAAALDHISYNLILFGAVNVRALSTNSSLVVRVIKQPQSSTVIYRGHDNNKLLWPLLLIGHIESK